jgi:hypothetical protein
MLFIMCKQLVGSSGKGLGLGGISIKSKVQIPMGVNNSLGLACPIRMEGVLCTGLRFTQQESIHEVALP